MLPHNRSEIDIAADSVTSSPRSDHQSQHDLSSPVRFMCSFGGKILPRPHDNQLRYVGGDTRIVAVNRATSYQALLTKLSKLSGISNIGVKYQLPHEDLDALISVTADEDVENMIDEYDRLTQNQNPRAARLRLFLFSKGDDSRASSISSLLEGSANREHWFFDALNGGEAASGSMLDRGRSEVSSIVSEVPDYLFGIDNPDENHHRDPKLKPRFGVHDNFSVSDPGSPAPVAPSPFCSASSAAPSLPDLRPVNTKPQSPDLVLEAKHHKIEAYPEPVEQSVSQPTGYPSGPMLRYVSDPRYQGPTVQQMPVYYFPGSVNTGDAPAQPLQIRPQYVHHQYPVQTGQIPYGYHQQIPATGQVFGGPMRPMAASMDQYAPTTKVVATTGVNQHVYYGAKPPGMVQMYPGMVVSGGEEPLHRIGSDANSYGHPSQS